MASKNKRYIETSDCNLCEGRFLCVKDCVTSFLEIKQEGDKQFVSFKDRGFCLDCGHCNSICPTGAVKGYSWNTDNEFLKFLATKRTVRRYNKNSVIPEASLELISLAAQSSPTEKNRGTVSVIFVRDILEEVFLEALEVLKLQVEAVGEMHPQYKYIMELYREKEPVFWGAEYAVLVVGKLQFSVDAALAAERMQLMAYSLGISSGYNGNLKSAINNSYSLKKKLGIIGDNQVLVSFAMGLSDFKYSSPYISKKKKIIYL